MNSYKLTTNLEKLFEEEGVEFGDLPDDDETRDGDESHVWRARVEPDVDRKHAHKAS